MRQPAFPHSHLGINRGQLSCEDSDYEDGMSLRDYFAAHAMQAMIASGDYKQHTAREVAIDAYLFADAMVQEAK